ncbi:hypothetical protein AVEN_102070-1 [Araneus ventricosus]|uniref:Uncharacterized protein n=1 Tax=Araneus ventricosus TaxID=182803 RepID=A0A4Y2WHL4_ARAVE|nr:hypothetical protein AVEN_102070-1 [Araneus ventricosus]
MRSDDIFNVMCRENFLRFSQSACAQRFSNSEKETPGNKICKQIAFAELRSATSSDGYQHKKLLDDHKIAVLDFTRIEDVEYDIESIVIKLCLPDVSRKKTDEREEFGKGILDEIDPGMSTHVKIMLKVQSTEAQNGDEKH